MMRYELVALLAVIALVVERVLARRELKSLLLALEQSVRAETARFRGEYAREFLSLREDVAHSHERLSSLFEREVARSRAETGLGPHPSTSLAGEAAAGDDTENT